MRVRAEGLSSRSRVGDIAEEAGVAHGLLYHYFRSKDEVLETIFRETWRAPRRRGCSASRRPERRCASSCGGSRGVYLGSWLVTPDLIRVLVREIARSPDVGERVERDRCGVLARSSG